MPVDLEVGHVSMKEKGAGTADGPRAYRAHRAGVCLGRSGGDDLTGSPVTFDGIPHTMRYMRFSPRTLVLASTLIALGACEHRLSGPTPAPASVAPNVVCIEQLTTSVTLRGDAFSPVPVNDLADPTYLALPSIDLLRSQTIDAMPAPLGPDGRAMPDIFFPGDPTPPMGDAGIPTAMLSQVHWTSEQQMAIDITPGLIPVATGTGLYDIRVTDRSGANGTLAGQLLAVPRPTLTAVMPDFICTEDHVNTITLTGDFFLMIGSMKPTVTIRLGTGMAHTYAPATMTDCRALPGPSGTMACRTATVTVPMGDLAPGTYDVTLTNPAPANCVSTDARRLTVVAAPTITNVSQLNICDDTTMPTTITINGTGFIFYTDAMGMAHVPTVQIGTSMMYPAMMPSPVGTHCTMVTGPTEMVQTCDQLTFTIPAGMYPDGMQTLVVTNPPPADCHTAAMISITFVPRPTVTGVTPTHICAGGGTLAISGTGFVAGATRASLDAMAASMNTVNSPTSLSSTWGTSVPIGGPYDLVVSNAPGCDATLSGVVTVIIGPQIFFADPPVLYSGIRTQVTLYVTGFSPPVVSASITPSAGGAAIPVTFVFDPTRPSRMQIVVPAGLADGDYDIAVTDSSACGANLPHGLHITATPTVSVVSVDPPFAWTGADSAITINGASPPPGGEVGFMPVPRMYLNPTVPMAGTIATPLEAVTLLSSSRATALVPRGLPVGSYDLIVVNPDATVGFLMNALSVVAMPPPTINTSSPGSVPSSSGRTTTVIGANFRNPTVTLRCAPAGGGAVMMVTTTASGATSTTVNAAFDASAIPAGSICVVRVTNDDMTYGEWSAIATTTPSLNIAMPNPSQAMITARRAPAGAGAQATAAARFVYAIGGDSGTLAGALSSVESVPIDQFGAASPFFAQRYALTTTRTFAGAAVVDRFIYVVGGSDGTAPLASVERAYVLDPADRTAITDLEIQVIPSGGLPPGLYYYRVAPLMGAADAYNPGGENLPSEEFPVILPTIAGHGLRLALTWRSVPGATGYRIYRSPTAGAAAGMEQLIHEVSGGAVVTYTDSGDAAMASAPLPLPLGSTGRWSVVATLGTARIGPAVTVVEDPVTAGTFYVYAAGGRGAANLTSIEIIPVTLGALHAETVGTVRTATGALSAGRWQASAFGAVHDVASFITSAQPYVYVVGGFTNAPGATAASSTVANAFPVMAGGDLPGSATVSGPGGGGRAGSGAAVANNLLYSFGGQGGGASTSIVSANICMVGGGGACAAGPPAVQNWNNAGVSLTTARVDMGTAIIPGFIFLLGGDGGAGPLTSTESTVW